MTPNRAALLHDVSGAIVASGYAVPVQEKRLHISRREQIEVLACDPCQPGSARLIDNTERK